MASGTFFFSLIKAEDMQVLALRPSWPEAGRYALRGTRHHALAPLIAGNGELQRAQVPRQVQTQLGLKDTASSILATIRP